MAEAQKYDSLRHSVLSTLSELSRCHLSLSVKQNYIFLKRKGRSARKAQLGAPFIGPVSKGHMWTEVGVPRSAGPR